MSSGMTNQSERETLGLMTDLAEMLRDEVLPTHLPLIQLLCKLCEDPALEHVDLCSKYIQLAALVGGDWITVKEELRYATSFGAPAFYCSVSSIVTVFKINKSRSHDELVSSITKLYNHISASNETLHKQVEYAITTMVKQMECANIAEASFANFNERIDIAFSTIGKQMDHANIAEAKIASIIEQADNAITTMKKQEELVNKAEASIANVIERAGHVFDATAKQTKLPNIVEVNSSKGINESPTDVFNEDIVPIPGTTFRCKYGTLTIDCQSQCSFDGSGLEAKSLAVWLTLPVHPNYQKKLMNLDHEELIKMTKNNLSLMHILKHKLGDHERTEYLDSFLVELKYKANQWCHIC